MATMTPPIRRTPTIKPVHVIGIGIIVVALVYGFFGFRDGFRSYTQSVDERSHQHEVCNLPASSVVRGNLTSRGASRLCCKMRMGSWSR